MANKSVQTKVTVAASDNFGAWLKASMKKEGISCQKLANAIGLERKTIQNYINNKHSPRLDTLAVLFDYFGRTEISIDLHERQEK